MNVAAVVPFLFLNEAGAYIEDILRVLREDRPDAILHDFAGIALPPVFISWYMAIRLLQCQGRMTSCVVTAFYKKPPAILRVLREERPDAILHDFAGIAGTMAADILGIPNVMLYTSYPSNGSYSVAASFEGVPALSGACQVPNVLRLPICTPVNTKLSSKVS